jgi:hypothetical protein
MKKSIILIVLIFTLIALLFSGCRTSEISQAQKTLTGDGNIQSVRIETLTGKVEILSDGTPALIAKWESKSRISYTIAGDMGKQIIAKVGEILTVECIVISRDSPWQGKLVIISVHP